MEDTVSELLELARLDEVAGRHADRRRSPRSTSTSWCSTRPCSDHRVPVDTTRVSAGRVHGRREQLARVVRNLLDNADRHARTMVAVELLTTATTAPSSSPSTTTAPASRSRTASACSSGSPASTTAAPATPAASASGSSMVKAIVEQHGGTVVDRATPRSAAARVTVSRSRRPDHATVRPACRPSSSSQLQRARRPAARAATACACPTTSSRVLRGFDADVIVMQESWRPDDEPAAVDGRRRRARRQDVRAAASGGHARPLAARPAATARARARSGSRSSAAARPTCVGTLPVGTVLGDHTPERGGAARRARRRRDAGRPRRRPPHVAPPARPPIQLARLAPAAPAAGPARDRRRRLQLLGPGRRARSSRAGGARCAGARGRRAVRTARSTTSSCAPRRSRSCDSEVLPDVGSDHRPVRATLARRLETTRMASTTVRGVGRVGARARRSRSETIVVPDPGPGEARVQVQACGVCHTDLHYREGAINDDFPFLLGHEAAGVVEAVGPDVARRRAGRLRDPQLARGVRHVPRVPARPSLVLLRHLQRDAEDDAPRRHAALAPRSASARSPRRRSSPRARPPRSTPRARPEAAGLLGCGVMAGLGAAMYTGDVGRGDSVAVFGCGGVGNAAIAGARLAGANTIIARRPRPAKLEWARGVRRDAHRQLARHRSGRGDPRAHRRQRRRRVHRGGRPPRGARAGVLRARPRRHGRAGRRARPDDDASSCR